MFPIVVPRHGSRWRLLQLLMVLVVLAVLIVPERLLPFVEQQEWTKVVATMVSLWGLVLLMGPARQMALGHGAFVGLGAYFTAIFTGRYGWPPIVSLVPASLAGFALGLVVGLPALRVRGQYLAMLTLGVAVGFPQAIQRFDWWTGGSAGPRPVPDARSPRWLSFVPDHLWLHLQICAVALGCALLLRNLLNSSVGRAIKAAAENEPAAAAMGVPVGRVMTMTYGVGGLLGALGGGLWVMQVRGVTTDQFDALYSIILYAVVVFGGMSSLLGAWFGALLLVGASVLISRAGWKVSPYLVYAVVLLAVTSFLAGGLTELLGRLGRRVVVFSDVPPERPPMKTGEDRVAAAIPAR